MTNVQKLEEIGIIAELRQRMGALDANSTSHDEVINALSHNEIMQEYTAWKLGYKVWWDSLKSIYDQLENLK